MANSSAIIVEYICAFFSSVVILVFISGIIILWKKGIKLEKNLKVVLFIEAVAVSFRAVYNFMSLAYQFKDESDEMKFIMWNLQNKSVGFMHLAFGIVIAKLFALLTAFSRRKLSRSLELIKRSNTLILYGSLIFFIVMLTNDIVIVVLYNLEEGN